MTRGNIGNPGRMWGDLYLVSRVPDKWCKIPLKPPPPAWLLGAQTLLFPCHWMFNMVTHNSPNIGQRDSHKEWTKIMHPLDILTRYKCNTWYVQVKWTFLIKIYLFSTQFMGHNGRRSELYRNLSMWLFIDLRFTILWISSFTTSLKMCEKLDVSKPSAMKWNSKC